MGKKPNVTASDQWSQATPEEEIEKVSITESDDIQATPEEEIKLLNDKKTYDIEVIQDSKHLKSGKKYTVSGNVANALLKKGLIKLV